jgi:hypothetical protein
MASKCDCGDPKCPFPDMPNLSRPDDTEADYFVNAVIWLQGHGYHDITTMDRLFKTHGIQTKFDDETLQRAIARVGDVSKLWPKNV